MNETPSSEPTPTLEELAAKVQNLSKAIESVRLTCHMLSCNIDTRLDDFEDTIKSDVDDRLEEYDDSHGHNELKEQIQNLKLRLPPVGPKETSLKAAIQLLQDYTERLGSNADSKIVDAFACLRASYSL
jgi:prefoldin subunit 5